MVFNDTGATRSLQLRWRLAPPDGKWQVSGSAPVLLGPAGRQQVRASLALPASSAEVTPASFSLELWDGGQRLFASSQDWKVYGRAALSGRVAGARGRAAVYDPQGETSRLLSGMGIECLPLDPENAPRVLHFLRVAVIGKGAFTPSGPPEAVLQDLKRFAEAGATVLVFEQRTYPATLIPLTLSRHSSSLDFARFVHHPVLTGLESAGLAHWLPDGVVGRRELVKPERGGFLPIVDSGGAHGLETAGLAELRVGQGRIVLCQLDVTSKYGIDPGATRIFRNLLPFASQRSPGSSRPGVFCDDAAAATLDSIGLQYDRLKWPLARSALRRYRTLLIYNLDQGISEPARIQEFVRDGGQVVLHRVTPDSLDLVRRLTGQTFALGPLAAGSVSLDDRSGPAAALSNQELAWFAPIAPEANAAPPLTTEIADYALRQPTVSGVPAKLKLAAPVYHTLPGLLVSSRLGRGLWVIDQVKWDQAGLNHWKGQRYLAYVLTNLGCEFAETAGPAAASEGTSSRSAE